MCSTVNLGREKIGKKTKLQSRNGIHARKESLQKTTKKKKKEWKWKVRSSVLVWALCVVRCCSTAADACGGGGGDVDDEDNEKMMIRRKRSVQER